MRPFPPVGLPPALVALSAVRRRRRQENLRQRAQGGSADRYSSTLKVFAPARIVSV